MYLFNSTRIYLKSTYADTVLGIRWDMNEFKEIDPAYKGLGMKTKK